LSPKLRTFGEEDITILQYKGLMRS
jgi:hypothetical protein